jgi:hypothetical protein
VRLSLILLLPIACASRSVPTVARFEFGTLTRSGELMAATYVPCSIGTGFGARFSLQGDGVVAIQSVWSHPSLPPTIARVADQYTARTEHVALSLDEPRWLESFWYISRADLQRSGIYELTVRAGAHTLLHRPFVVEDCPDGG